MLVLRKGYRGHCRDDGDGAYVLTFFAMAQETVVLAHSAPAGESEKISDVAPTSEGARKAILNAAAKACWHLDPKSQRWLCPDCASARDASKHPESLGMSDGATRSQKGRGLEELFAASHLS